MRKGHVEQARAFFQVIIVESNHCTGHSTRNIFDWGSFPKQVMQKKKHPSDSPPHVHYFTELVFGTLPFNLHCLPERCKFEPPPV